MFFDLVEFSPTINNQEAHEQNAFLNDYGLSSGNLSLSVVMTPNQNESFGRRSYES